MSNNKRDPVHPIEAESSVHDADLIDEPEVFDEAEVIDAAEAPPEIKKGDDRVEHEDVTAEDREFIARVFLQVKDVDFRGPPPPPPKGLSGPDKKLHDLRETVRKLERQLARVGYIWNIKLQEVEKVEQIIAAKESERLTAVQRYEQFKQQATRAAQQAKSDIESLTHQRDEATARIASLENQLADLQTLHDSAMIESSQRIGKQEQEILALHADFRQKLATAQSAFNDLREQSTKAIASLEETKKNLESTLEQAQQELESTKSTLATSQADVTSQAAALAKNQEALARLGDRLAERDQTMAKIADELSHARTTHENQQKQLREQIKGLETQLQSSNEDLKQAKGRIADLEAKLASSGAARSFERPREADSDRPSSHYDKTAIDGIIPPKDS